MMSLISAGIHSLKNLFIRVFSSPVSWIMYGYYRDVTGRSNMPITFGS